LLELAGHEPDIDLDWIRFPYEIAEMYITQALERLQEQQSSRKVLNKF